MRNSIDAMSNDKVWFTGLKKASGWSVPSKEMKVV